MPFIEGKDVSMKILVGQCCGPISNRHRGGQEFLNLAMSANDAPCIAWGKNSFIAAGIDDTQTTQETIFDIVSPFS
jgi:hypothetical protein